MKSLEQGMLSTNDGFGMTSWCVAGHPLDEYDGARISECTHFAVLPSSHMVLGSEKENLGSLEEVLQWELFHSPIQADSRI